MGVLIIVLLALAWVVVLAPSVLKPRFESSPIDGVRSFERSMGILASTRTDRQTPGRWVMVPKGMASEPRSRRARVIERRRKWLVRLLAAASLTLVLALAFPRMFWIHLVLDAGLLVYVVQLKRWAAAERQRKRVVHRLHAEPVGGPITEPVPAVRIEADEDEPPRAAGFTG